jgi:hypothetical protein
MKMLALAFGLLLVGCSRPYDASYETHVSAPAYVGSSPRILVDQGHHNRHDISGTYKPFAELLRSDGCSVKVLRGRITRTALEGVQVLVIPSALGTDDENTSPAFSRPEVETIVTWIAAGGSLLLITDHFPFGDAVKNLAAPLGVQFSGGMTFDPVHHDANTDDDSRIEFSRQNGLLPSHPITEGRAESERVNRVLTFTGQAVRTSKGIPLLRLSRFAVNRAALSRVTRHRGDTRVEVTFGPPTSAEGWAQAVALEYGKGRVVVLGEAAMVTAQRDGGKPIGMNVPNTDNRQFLLNTIHWLTRL